MTSSSKSQQQQQQQQQEEVISNGVSSSYNNRKSGKLTTENVDNKEHCKTKHNNHIEDYEIIEQSLPKRHNVNDYEEENLKNDEQAKAYKHANGVTKNPTKLNTQKELSPTTTSNKKGKSTNTVKEGSTAQYTNNKEDLIIRQVEA